MKAYVIEQAGGPEVLKLQDLTCPLPRPDEVKIRVRAFGLNRTEVFRRAGMLGAIESPIVPGIEAVGEVIDDPSGSFRQGQRVATAMGGMQFSRHGSYAEEVTVLRSNVVDLDGTTLSWAELAALPEAYLTIWGALDKSLAIRSGQTLMVRGATSSVGTAALTYAKARGLAVIATTRSNAKASQLRALGADEVVIDSGEVATQVRSLVPSGVDAVLEVVGQRTLRDSIQALRPFGGVSVIGHLDGPPVIDQLHLIQDLPVATRLSFFPSTLFGTPDLPLDDSPLNWVAGEVATGRMPSILGRTFAFDEVPEAHRLMESNAAFGKLVVTL